MSVELPTLNKYKYNTIQYNTIQYNSYRPLGREISSLSATGYV